MKRVTINNVHLWQFDHLSAEPRVHHFITDRNTHGKEFTLSLSSLPDKQKIHSNREMLASAFSIPPSQLYFPSQVHETRIVNITGKPSREELANTDALVTADKEVCIAVMSADCVPILLYDKTNHAVAAIHSGWRGTVARILEKTLHQMNTLFGTKGEDLIAGIGPSIGREAYEVGEEVIGKIHQAFGDDKELMVHHRAGKAKLDLWKANKIQLMEFGVSESQIEISSLCTVTNNEHFFSARKGDTGRFAAGIMLR